MASLPPIIDIRDDLYRAEEETDAAVDEELETVLDRLDAFEDRDLADREGVLDEIDNQLLRLEELLDGEPSRRIAAARNRIHIFRGALQDTSEGLTVVESTARDRAESEVADASGEATDSDATGRNAADADDSSGRRGNEPRSSDADDGREVAEDRILPVGDATIAVTVANSGDDREVVPVVSVYDEDGDEIGTTSGPAVPLEAGAQRRIELDVDVPPDASYYATTVVESTEWGGDPDEYDTDAVT